MQQSKVNTVQQNKTSLRRLTAVLCWVLCCISMATTVLIDSHMNIKQEERILKQHLSSRVSWYDGTNTRITEQTPQAALLAASNVPIYFKTGTLGGAVASINWPENCPPSANDVRSSTISTVVCQNQQVVFYATADSPNPERQAIFWMVAPANNPVASLAEPQTFGLITLGSALIAYLMTFILSRLMYAPMYRATQVIKAICKGKYDKKLELSPYAETASLESSINQMVEAIALRDANIRKQAFRDPITGLDNVAFVNLSLQDRLAQAREPIAIILCTLTNLREVYEIMGQHTRDQALIRFGKRIRRICPNYITLARLEGFDFCLVVPQSSLLETSEYTFTRILSFNLRTNGCDLDLKCTAGVTLFPQHGQTAETLLRRAEMAKHQASQLQVAYSIFTTDIEAKAAKNLEILADLKRAVSNEDFELFFQPKVHLESGKVTQVEGLIRWRHPQKGITAPGFFIELAERTGLICQITRWALKEGYEKAAMLAPLNVGISLNISARDLEDNAILHYCTALHAENPKLTSHLTLEITESSTMHDPEKANQLLSALAKLGFKISIDDYGTGYSSLAYLKRFPASELKIDRSLVAEADKNPDSTTILRSTIDMGHSMSMIVTVEGVETESEFRLMHELGADFVQGYYVSKPIKFDQLLQSIVEINHAQVTQPI